MAPVDQAALISSTIHGFPNGGEPLKLAISDLIVKHRNLAASLVTVLRNDPSLTPAQKQAIVAGLADALNRLGIVAADLMPLKAAPAAAAGRWWLSVVASCSRGCRRWRCLRCRLWKQQQRRTTPYSSVLTDHLRDWRNAQRLCKRGKPYPLPKV